MRRVLVDKCYFTEKYPYGCHETKPFRVVCLVVKDGIFACEKVSCRSTCDQKAIWVRTPDRQKQWEVYKTKGFAGASWNFDAHKVCTSYIHKETP